jgi:hypothetical protein
VVLLYDEWNFFRSSVKIPVHLFQKQIELLSEFRRFCAELLGEYKVKISALNLLPFYLGMRLGIVKNLTKNIT